MKTAVVALSSAGAEMAASLTDALGKPDMFLLGSVSQKQATAGVKPFTSLAELTSEIFHQYQGIVFIMATGIVVRVIAPHLKDKHTDPAIVVVDEGCHFAISLLSGHEGGANELAILVANALGAEPVVTTASEVRKPLIIGIGSRKGIAKEAVRAAIEQALQIAGHNIASVRWAATIDIKGREPGIVDACREWGIPLRLIPGEAIKNFKGYYRRSEMVKRRIGVEGVCEPCALLAGKNPQIILPKTSRGGVTVAIARENSSS